MKLIATRVKEYKSIWDSNDFEIGDITCLVGKNEAGKTALLEALYKLNPIISTDSEFDVTNDYPRAEVSDYEEDVSEENREPATVVEGTFELQGDDMEAITSLFGKKALKNKKLTLSRKYPDSRGSVTSTRTFSLEANKDESIKYLIQKANIPADLQKKLTEAMDDVAAMLDLIATVEATEDTKRLTKILKVIQEHDVSWYIYNKLLSSRVPKFLYFDEYYQMKGHENIEALKSRQESADLEQSDYPMLGLIGLARLDLDQLLESARTQDLVNKLEGAGNRLSKKVLQYWSQNKHVQMRFDVRPARPNDPPGLTSGTNIWANVYDSRHMVSTNLGTRSRGFVWFFSFLAWYSQIEKDYKGSNVILLLDEPGLFLHGKAQEDLLNYFEQELKDKHQTIYTTHSPFMVDSRHFERVRIVQDSGIEHEDKMPKENDGTKVFTDVLEAHEDSLFPLQGALGYEIYQTLFVGKNCLVVEGVSDLLFIQTVSTFLERSGRTGLSTDWTITPVGGSDKVPTFGQSKGTKCGYFD
ncbi:DNA replication and repair protein RecF [bacterium BMS3Abin10]|nr:DNA replication and repair protein RecF [bacterium BMS3Abin10]GBE39129.1 DNA replication and repair protein RecF [bacterium BMS3Bbin08]